MTTQSFKEFEHQAWEIAVDRYDASLIYSIFFHWMLLEIKDYEKGKKLD